MGNIATIQSHGAHGALVERFRNPPNRVAASLVIFGGLLGMPAVCVAMACVFSSLDMDAFSAVFAVFAGIWFFGTTILAWVFILRARGLLQRAEQAYFARNYYGTVEHCFAVLKTVFRADYRVSAYYLLGLAAEHAGCFEEAARLFTQGDASLPALVASLPARRARSLMHSHAAINWAALGRVAEARASLSRCHQALGPHQVGVLDALRVDDSHFGQMGLAAQLNELEGRRDPRPLAALAGAFVALRSGDHYAALDMVTREGPALTYGLSPDERVLLSRIASEANMQLASSGDPHRSMARVDDSMEQASPWVDAVLPARRI